MPINPTNEFNSFSIWIYQLFWWWNSIHFNRTKFDFQFQWTAIYLNEIILCALPLVEPPTTTSIISISKLRVDNCDNQINEPHWISHRFHLINEFFSYILLNSSLAVSNREFFVVVAASSCLSRPISDCGTDVYLFRENDGGRKCTEKNPYSTRIMFAKFRSAFLFCVYIFFSSKSCHCFCYCLRFIATGNKFVFISHYYCVQSIVTFSFTVSSINQLNQRDRKHDSDVVWVVCVSVYLTTVYSLTCLPTHAMQLNDTI